ncbi:MAG TPA: orotate phosphoribosyltransferase [Gemmatimonadaceae bacterium]|nr:orotate phosphoribosyltransferase [Gemmatimonadaceae bacterium]
MTDLEQLIALLAAQSVKRGDFVLSSGRRSDLYVDARMTTMHPRGLALIGPLGLAAMSAAGWDAESVGGLTLGADPIAYAIAYASAIAGRPIRAFTVRKEAKTHGTGKRIEGPFQSGDRVVVIEDSVTSGASALNAVAAVRAQGGRVLGVLALVDREEGGRKAIEAEGVSLQTLVTRAQLLAHS